ncbi:hypothetical protein CK203_039088 [Vitis vinifera]|uniref:Uncharacterized protein n=1 Tax=Vitis vinifera TaxID=29760 RepID=A0A438IFT0_VITVI|nr:hypothetical protein CK203_039088 [Vitis vinifera]
MTTRGVPTLASILFTIDGRQGTLGARQIAEAFHIPYALADPAAFKRWASFMSGTWRGAILEALFRTSEGYYFGPHHLIMASLLHFEEKTLILRHTAIVEGAFLSTNGISSLGARTRGSIDQQTLILREIQQHLGLLPPAPPVSPVPSEPFASTDDFDTVDDATPVAVPSTVAVEDPSYPPEETTT